jgi:alanine-synthesizing transaminase
VRTVEQSRKLRHVAYDIRGPVPAEAARMEAEGHRVIKLNIGNPAPFGFEAPDEIAVDMMRQLPVAQGYTDSRGILPARRAVAQYYQTKNLTNYTIDDIWLGNGVSELIQLSLQALLDVGDEVLIPAPDYPLWTASAALAGGTPVHYLCDEDNHWWPDLEDLESRITPRTVAMVVINPNNPTGAVYPREVLQGMVDIARRHDLIIFADEIYDKILYDGAEHVSIASLAPDLLCVTMNGLSKSYRVAGYRSGWMVLSGPKEHAASYLEGLNILANMRLCANAPAQHVIATALGGYQSIHELTRPGGRLWDQKNLAHRLLTDIEGVTCEPAEGALYLFPRLDPERFPITDDVAFALDMLRKTKVLVVQGSGFNWPHPDHFRIVTLPNEDDLEEAIGRIGEYLDAVRR